MKPKHELIRVVKDPNGDISLDITGRKNGRGAYVCKDINCIKKTRKIKALSHTFSTNVNQEVYDELEKEFNEIGK